MNKSTAKKEIKILGLSTLSGSAGSRQKKKRVGRGTSSGHGKTCCRGHKGQKSRSGGVKRPGFEGGQTPLYRRLPKLNRFKNFDFKIHYAVVNLGDLKDFDGIVNPETMAKNGFIREGERFKVLGDGEISKALTIEAHAFSKSAQDKIAKAGGKAVLISKLVQGE